MSLPHPIGGKTVVITGAARGIGEQLALTLSERGARVALVGLERERLEDVAKRCGANAASWENSPARKMPMPSSISFNRPVCLSLWIPVTIIPNRELF